MRVVRVIGLALLWLATLPCVAMADSARAWLDRDSMRIGETVTLNVQVEGTITAEPDFSALATDFRTLGTQSSRQFNMTNGQATASTLWAIGLEPKHEGTFDIPALTVGSLTTTPLRLVVAAAPAGAQGKAGDAIYIEVSAEPSSPYVQQQVRYVVKLFYAVDLTEGALDEPAIDGIVVQKLGRDRQYAATVGERRYRVLERHYALIPERSGPIEMPALAFRGSTVDSGDPTGFFRRGRAITARSDALTLDVRAKPQDWGPAPWLPAADFTISDESDLPTRVEVGEPITRTIRMRAQGLAFEQLPELSFDAPEGSDVYPDKPETQTRDDGSWLYGERTRKFAVVPGKPGKLVLPPVQVDWWDTASNRRVTAVLPAHEIEVVAAAGAPTVAPPAATTSQAPASAPTTVAYPSAFETGNARIWRILAIAATSLWLVTLLLWWRSRRSSVEVPRDRASAIGENAGRSVFLRACAMGDVAGAERAILGWARSERPQWRNLGEIAAQLDDEAQREALHDLQRVRYAGASIDALAARLERAFKRGFAWSDTRATVASTSPLPPLYPR